MFVLMLVSGCSEPAAGPGTGTMGSLRFGTETVSGICVVVHRRVGAEYQEVGYGTTLPSGTFGLVARGGTDALFLEPGDYVFTLEPLGPQIAFPAEYLTPEKTPLKTTWTADAELLNLEAPEKLISGL